MSTKITLMGLAKALETLRDLEQEQLTVQQALTFVYVCLNEGQPFKFYADQLGVAQSTMSRNMAALGEVHRLGSEGLKLVLSEPDPAKQNRKLAKLTGKGKRVRDAVVAALETGR